MFDLLAIVEQNELFAKAMGLLHGALVEIDTQLNDLRGRVEQLEKERSHE